MVDVQPLNGRGASPHVARGTVQNNNRCMRYSFSVAHLRHPGFIARIRLFIVVAIATPSWGALQRNVLIRGTNIPLHIYIILHAIILSPGK